MTAAQLAMSYIEAYARLLMVVPLVFVAIVAVVWMLTVAIRWQLWSARRRRAARQAVAERFRPDGEPYPPGGRGMCDRCQAAHEKVYFLQTGRRLCEACYFAEHPVNPRSQQRGCNA